MSLDEVTEDSVVFFICGDLDADTLPRVHDMLMLAVEAYRVVRCDLTRAGFFGAAAVNTIAAVAQHARGRGHLLELCGVGETAARVLRIVGLDRVLRITADPFR